VELVAFSSSAIGTCLIPRPSPVPSKQRTRVLRGFRTVAPTLEAGIRGAISRSGLISTCTSRPRGDEDLSS
jgi:hypothetical protein